MVFVIPDNEPNITESTINELPPSNSYDKKIFLDEFTERSKTLIESMNKQSYHIDETQLKTIITKKINNKVIKEQSYVMTEISDFIYVIQNDVSSVSTILNKWEEKVIKMLILDLYIYKLTSFKLHEYDDTLNLYGQLNDTKGFAIYEIKFQYMYMKSNIGISVT